MFLLSMKSSSPGTIYQYGLARKHPKNTGYEKTTHQGGQLSTQGDRT
jgi:hypothetical protein